MYSTYSHRSGEHRRPRHHSRHRIHAIVSFLVVAERRGLRISPHAQYVIENECLELYKHVDGPLDKHQFAALLKETAVRMFRQSRYREANQRYRMAALFNPHDPTLLSNRAICLYNLRRYKRCIEVCQLCFSAFTNLLFDENIRLYFQILLLVGNSHIKLCNFDESHRVYNTLLQIQQKFTQPYGELSIKWADTKIQRFQLDLTLARASPQNVANEDTMQASNASQRPPDFPYDEERGRFLHPRTPPCYLREINTGIDDYDFSRDQDYDSSLLVNVERLCHHVYPMGAGPCEHFDNDDVCLNSSPSSYDGTEGESDGHSPSHDERSNCVDLENDDKNSSECNCNVLNENIGYSNESEKDPSIDSESLPPFHDFDYDSDLSKNQATYWSRDQDVYLVTTVPTLSSQGNGLDFVLASDASIESSNVSFQSQWTPPSASSFLIDYELPMIEAVMALRVARNTASACLERSSAIRDAEYWTRVSELAAFAAEKLHVNPSPRRTKFFESENEEPISQLSRSFVLETEVQELVQKCIGTLPTGKATFLGRCVSKIFGDRFRLDGSLDFTSYFGPHTRFPSARRKRNKSCIRNCAPCFARRMWKHRFKCYKPEDASQLSTLLHGDNRLDKKTFLPPDHWLHSGNYASGYEPAFDDALLVHGVAYIILLQNEICWQRNGVRDIPSMQMAFKRAVLQSLRTESDLMAALKLFEMFRETLILMVCFRYHESKGLPRSFQFYRTPQSAAEIANTASELPDISNKETEAELMSRNGTPFQNVLNWSLLGYVSKEEELVYQGLLCDVRDLILYIQQRGLERGSDALHDGLRVFLDGPNSEPCSLLKIWYKQRICELEKKSSSRKASDLDRGEILLTRAIEADNTIRRLHFQRAEIRFRIKKWDLCIEDLQKLQSLMREATLPGGAEINSVREKALLYHALILEGDAYSQKKPGERSFTERFHIMTSLDKYRNALSLGPKTKRSRLQLQRKIREQCALLASVDDNVGNDSATSMATMSSMAGASHRQTSVEGNMGNSSAITRGTMSFTGYGRHRKPSEKENVTNFPQDSFTSSDETEGGEDGFVSGSRYGALLKEPRSGSLLNLNKPGASVSGSSQCNSHFTESRSEVDRPWRTRTNHKPRAENILSEIRRILTLFGGEARSSDITTNIDLTQWGISDPKSYVEQMYGTLYNFCANHGEGFETRAGSHSDPVIAQVEKSEFTPVLKRRPTGSPRSHGNDNRGQRNEIKTRPQGSPARNENASKLHLSSNPSGRMSETLGYAELVRQLLHEGSSANQGNSRDEASSSNGQREKECCICMDNTSDSLTIPCKHPFCEDCILKYLARENSSKVCPMCRTTITNVESLIVHR